MKILNLYSGIGGNRKKWDETGIHEITAVEYDPKIAAIYKYFFPNDTVIVADAHQYLLDHYKEFDFIWASPPCPTHSRVNYFLNAKGCIRYPDMNLYQEIIFLQYFFNGLYCVENVNPYYEPLIKPQYSGRHYFWANFKIPEIKGLSNVNKMFGKTREPKQNKNLGIEIPSLKWADNSKNLYRKVLNNCCHPEIGLAILNSALGIIVEKSVKNGELFA